MTWHIASPRLWCNTDLLSFFVRVRIDGWRVKVTRINFVQSGICIRPVLFLKPFIHRQRMSHSILSSTSSCLCGARIPSSHHYYFLLNPPVRHRKSGPHTALSVKYTPPEESSSCADVV